MTAQFWEYDTRTGRRWNLDPKGLPWESPYSAFGGNPVLNNDPNGDFWWKDHIAIDKQAFKAQYGGFFGSIVLALSTVTTVYREAFRSGHNATHLDNMSNAEMRSFLEGGGYMHMTNHQTQDFYAHSNYVEVMKENGYTDENMVTFDQLDPKSEIFSKVMSTLRTEVYKDDGSVKNGHDGKLHGGQDKFVSDPKSVPTGSDDFMAKDANGADGKTLLSDGTYGGFKHPNHDGAVRLATDATERKLAGTTVNNAQGTNTQCADECQ